MSKKTIDDLLNSASGFDVYPVVKLRPLLSPPRGNAKEAPDPILWTLFCPNHGKIEVISDQLTRFPTVITCNGRPVVVTQGTAIFIGQHLMAPSRRERLLQVLQGLYGDDVLLGNHRRWIENPGVRSSWTPISQETLDELRGADAFGRAKALPAPCMARDLEPV